MKTIFNYLFSVLHVENHITITSVIGVVSSYTLVENFNAMHFSAIGVLSEIIAAEFFIIISSLVLIGIICIAIKRNCNARQLKNLKYHYNKNEIAFNDIFCKQQAYNDANL